LCSLKLCEEPLVSVDFCRESGFLFLHTGGFMPEAPVKKDVSRRKADGFP
jgi:hypothetical protein